jgi:biotin-dependent carboxylase-like uncharacterized protein
MILSILKPGLLATIQDLGRPASQAWGVPVGGAADTLSHRLANFLAGNPGEAATLEVAGGGWLARVEEGGWLGVTGAEGSLHINGQPAPCGRTIYMSEGAVIGINPGESTLFSYLAVPGGWTVPIVLGSASTCLAAEFGGLGGRSMKAGDVLKGPTQARTAERAGCWVSPWRVKVADFYTGVPEDVMYVIPGPEWNWWQAEQQQAFGQLPWTISAQSDRMGIRLEGQPLLYDEQEPMLSSAVGAGAIQVPPDGCPIILMADAQTTGGYPRIGQVAAADLPKLSQRPTGSTLRFRLTDLFTAEQLLFEQEQQLGKVEIALKYSFVYG